MTTQFLKSIVCLTGGLLCAAVQADTVLIQHARLISGDQPAATAPMDVVVEDGRIQAIGTNLGPFEHVIDAKGHFLIPGLIDTHVHLDNVPGYRGTDPNDHDMVEEATQQIPRSYLYFGFTTLLDLAGSGKFIQHWNSQAVTPHAYYCAPLLIPNGYPMVFIADKTHQFDPADGRYMMFDAKQTDAYPAGWDRTQHTPAVLIAQAKRAGASCIKVFYETGFGAKRNLPVPSMELLQEVTREAHKQALPVYMHGNTEASYRVGLQAGIDVLAHGMWNEPSTGPNKYDLEGERQLAAQLIAAHIAIQPTIQVIYGEQEIFNPAFFDNPRLRQAIPDRLLNWYRSEPGQWMKDDLGSSYKFDSTDPTARYATVKDLYRPLLDSVQRMTTQLFKQGGRVQFGSDSPSGPFYTQYPGINGRMEMDRWIDAGISLTDLFRAMTIVNARALGMDKSIGSIQIGARGDLLLLAENPLEKVSAYDSIEWVMLNGLVHERNSLSAQKSGHNAP